jgi:6-pyruvoyltetrahydropterin/6-carboxytetrahydropterin synthase
MTFTLSQRFMFDAAHTLNRGEASERIHGHTYHCEISMSGAPDPRTGMVCDLAELQSVADGVRDVLDHRLLDTVPDLGPATLENLCLFIGARVRRYPTMSSVRVWRADGGSCLLTLAAPTPPADGQGGD